MLMGGRIRRRQSADHRVHVEVENRHEIRSACCSYHQIDGPFSPNGALRVTARDYHGGYAQPLGSDRMIHAAQARR